MKSKLNPVPAANRTQEIINNVTTNYVELKRDEAQKLVTGIYELDAKVKLKDSQIVTITKEKSDLQQLVTSKTSEIQSKNSLLSQKEQLLVQKEQLLSELRIKEENQLKEEYISVLHQLNPKVFSANYEDWSGKAQGFKDIIDQGKFKTIRKKLPVYKQQLAQNIETEKLALATKEAERLDNAKQEVVSILNQLHPHSYPANFEEWSTHHAAHNSRAKALLDSNNLGAIEKKLVHYRELLKQEVQNKDQLILQKEEEFKSLNDTFTSSILTKEEEIITKSQLLSQSNTKVKKVSRKLAQEIQSKNQLALQKAMEEEIRIQKEQENERLRELLAQNEIQTQELLARQELEKQELLIQKEREKEELLALKESELLTQKEIETQELLARIELEKQELLIQKEREKEELLALKENELREKEELLLAKESEIHNKSAEKNRIIEELASNLLTKEEEIVSKNLKIGEVSHKAKKVGRKLAAKDNLLSDKEQKIEELKALIEQTRLEKEELLAQQETLLANKSHMKNQIIDGLREEVELKKNEVIDLKIQNLEKELMTQEQEKLLIQKEMELADKSFAKNQVIGELQEDIDLKEKEALNLKIELLMKQVEFHKKESELKDKALEDAREIAKQKQVVNELKEKELADVLEIVKQKDVINELQGKLLDLEALYGHDVSFAEEFSAIQFQAENNIANNDFGAIQDLSRYISALLGSERENAESIDISKLLALNESPIVNVEENHVQQHVPVINHGNFDINQMHITHSVLLGGEGSESFSIIKEDHID